MIEDFLIELKNKGYSPNTIKAYRHSLAILRDYDYCTMSTADLMVAFAHNWKPNTVAARQAAIRSFFEWLYQKGLINYNPVLALGSVGGEKKPAITIPKKDIDKIFTVINNISLEPKTLFWLLWDTGWQIKQVLLIDVEDICLEGASAVITIKGGQVSLSNDTYTFLNRLCQQQIKGPLFTSIRGKRASYYWAYYWWEKVMAEADLNYTLCQFKKSSI